MRALLPKWVNAFPPCGLREHDLDYLCSFPQAVLGAAAHFLITSPAISCSLGWRKMPTSVDPKDGYCGLHAFQSSVDSCMRGSFLADGLVCSSVDSQVLSSSFKSCSKDLQLDLSQEGHFGPKVYLLRIRKWEANTFFCLLSSLSSCLYVYCSWCISQARLKDILESIPILLHKFKISSKHRCHYLPPFIYFIP